tara:strand:+ start:1840 stop:2118 length:279 start_codon:yes stop_codon:yes gene_type:complete
MKSYTPTEEDARKGRQVTYIERVILEDGSILAMPVEDTIVTLTHPLTARTLTGPSSIVAKVFARWDFIVGHQNMAEEITRNMLRLENGDSEE